MMKNTNNKYLLRSRAEDENSAMVGKARTESLLEKRKAKKKTIITKAGM